MDIRKPDNFTKKNYSLYSFKYINMTLGQLDNLLAGKELRQEILWSDNGMYGASGSVPLIQ